MRRPWRIGKVRLQVALRKHLRILFEQAKWSVGQYAAAAGEPVREKHRVQVAIERNPFPRDSAMALVQVPENFTMTGRRATNVELAERLQVLPEQHMIIRDGP